ncbi:MAG: transglutaminase domain-containing protein [Thermoproteota archaeon]
MKQKRLAKKQLAIEVAALLSVVIGSILLAGAYPRIERTASYLFVHEIKLENRGREPYVLKDLWLGMLLNTTTQTSYLIECSPEGENIFDSQGNSFVAIPEITLQAGDSFEARITLKVLTKTSWSLSEENSVSECFSSIPDELIEKYCKQEGPFQTNDPQLVSLAYTIREGANCTVGSILNVLETTIRWIDDNIRYDTHVPPLYPNQTIVERSGDCDEKANLLITLCRIMKIPAYLQTGFVIQSNETNTYLDGHYRSEGLVGHAWAMVYIPPYGWLPVDMTYYENAQDPLSHITSSALVKELVIQSANVTSTDYIDEWRKWTETLYEHNIYELNRYKLETLDRNTIMVYPMIFFAGVALLSSGATILIAMEVKRRRARKMEKKERDVENITEGNTSSEIKE